MVIYRVRVAEEELDGRASPAPLFNDVRPLLLAVATEPLIELFFACPVLIDVEEAAAAELPVYWCLRRCLLSVVFP